MQNQNTIFHINEPCVTVNRPLRLRQGNAYYVDIQSLKYLRIILNVPSFQFQNLYLKSQVYMLPFVAVSILSGVWGIQMCVRVSESAGLAPQRRFVVLQLALIIVKVQWGLAKALPAWLMLPCIISMHPSVFVHSK